MIKVNKMRKLGILLRPMMTTLRKMTLWRSIHGILPRPVKTYPKEDGLEDEHPSIDWGPMPTYNTYPSKDDLVEEVIIATKI